MQRLVITLSIGVLVAIVYASGNAESAAVTMCSAVSSQNPNQNSAINPNFESCSTNTQASCEGKKVKGNCEPLPAPTAIGWKINSDNSGSKATSKCVSVEVSGKNDRRMLKLVSNGNKRGVFLELPNLKSDAKRMLSTWVWVRSGQVAIAQQDGNKRPVSWSTKGSGWEQLRICSNGAVPTNSIVISNQVKGGSRFEVDRIEMGNIP